MNALRALGKGNIDTARDSLEMTLDSSISSIRLTSGFSPKLQSFAPSLAHTDHILFLKRIAKYRFATLQYPGVRLLPWSPASTQAGPQRLPAAQYGWG